MYIFAYAMQLLALLCALGGAGMALIQLWQGRANWLHLIEKAHWLVSGALLLASALLLHALFWQDYSLVYVASYTDKYLPIFYRLTAFWAGQPGSMLFWALTVALGGSIFGCLKLRKQLSAATRLWYWVFFYAIMAFFALVLTCWSDPFVMQRPAPVDGNGLNPLLQNPGMIFHPPLLFLGYGGFTVPSCLALAQLLSGQDGRDAAWFRLTRPFIILAWAFLTAGIVLGAWWAYMELGWGGYWAWDPVENASLIPWLIGSAALHTLVIEDRRGKLGRVNVAMMSLTTVSAFFATYLVRSGVVQSVHAFGDGSVGTPLTIFILAGLVVTFWVACAAPNKGEPLAGLDSREGFLTLVAWILLALAVIILIATMWPVISKIWGAEAQGLDANFYNRVCLPLAAVLVLMLAVCPWLGWEGKLRQARPFIMVLAAMLGAAGVIAFMGYTKVVPLVAAAASVGIMVGIVLLLGNKALRGSLAFWGPAGAHLGLALMALGIAFSGPYTLEQELYMGKGDTKTVGAYSVTLLDIADGQRPGYDFIASRLEIRKDGELLGVLAPERRMYEKFGTMQFSEVDVIPSLGNEVYASLLGMDEDMQVYVQISIEPLVNWLWIGGTIICLAPLLGLRRRYTAGKKQGASAGKAA